ncbi:MAG TPA: hypothetical protein VG819_05100 [Rhizomicrobium sp.]|jgi:hypothetical protein|nr:hypothetical protein [Rhizomicrobium sp.]
MLVLALFGAGPAALAEGTFVPAANRMDMAYDEIRHVLYISNGPELVRFQVSTKTMLDPIAIGGQLTGLDISPDGKTLAVEDYYFDFNKLQNRVYLVDMESLSVKTVNFEQERLEGGT